MDDVRKTLPRGINAEDMKADGSRWCMMHIYGPPYTHATMMQIMKVWEVKKWWLIARDSTDGVTQMPKITNDGGPEFMLMFADGKWRHASFGGLNGPPCAACWSETWDGPNGEAAYHSMMLARKIRHRESKEREVADLANQIAELKERLSRSLVQPKRKDETWK